jgi:vacuolar-type H+-ATPase subunit F/Vma7
MQRIAQITSSSTRKVGSCTPHRTSPLPLTLLYVPLSRACVCTEIKHDALVEAFRSLTSRDDISVVLITQTIAQEIRYLINSYDKTIPTILEIPSKDKPYKEEQDPIMQRVLRLLGARD